jgi:hypothetical protein
VYLWWAVVEALSVLGSFDQLCADLLAFDYTRVGSVSAAPVRPLLDLGESFMNPLLEASRGENPPG